MHRDVTERQQAEALRADKQRPEVMRRVRAHSQMQGLRIVALSADAMPGPIEAALAAGFDDCGTKPIQFDALLGHIDKLAAEVSGAR